MVREEYSNFLNQQDTDKTFTIDVPSATVCAEKYINCQDKQNENAESNIRRSTQQKRVPVEISIKNGNDPDRIDDSNGSTDESQSNSDEDYGKWSGVESKINQSEDDNKGRT